MKTMSEIINNTDTNMIISIIAKITLPWTITSKLCNELLHGVLDSAFLTMKDPKEAKKC